MVVSLLLSAHQLGFRHTLRWRCSQAVGFQLALAASTNPPGPYGRAVKGGGTVVLGANLGVGWEGLYKANSDPHVWCPRRCTQMLHAHSFLPPGTGSPASS